MRALDEVDADRIAVWAFSLSGLPRRAPRAGKERPTGSHGRPLPLGQADVTGTAVHVVDVPDGQHGFDAADHTDEFRRAVLRATDLVTEYLV